LFRLESDTGCVLEGVLDDRVIGTFTSVDGGRVDFTASESNTDRFGEVTQATSTSSTQSNCFCNTTYHRVYCKRSNGSWYWNGNFC
jgi:hypothetical protein